MAEIVRIEKQDDYIDAVAQAVIDRIEEQQRLSTLVDAVVARVIEMQRQEAELKAEELAQVTLLKSQEGGKVDG